MNMENEYYRDETGWVTCYVNAKNGKKKFQLEEGDRLIERELDDFFRPEIESEENERER